MGGYNFDDTKFPLHGIVDNDELSEDEKVNKLRELLSDSNINQQDDEYNYTLLHVAARNQLPHVVNLLVEAGAHINITTTTTSNFSKGVTPLHEAAYRGYTSIALALVKAGADIHIINSDGRTALHDAANSGSTDILLALINAGADINITDIQGMTAQDILGYPLEGMRTFQIIRQLLNEIENMDNLPPQTLHYLNNIKDFQSIQELKEQGTARFDLRLSRIISSIAILTNTKLDDKIKSLLEIPKVFLGEPGEKLNPETFCGYLEDLKLSTKTGKLEAKLYTSGLQGAGKTSVVYSLENPQLSENNGKEFTPLMQEHSFTLERSKTYKISVRKDDAEGLKLLHIEEKIEEKEPPNEKNTDVEFELKERVPIANQLHINAHDIGGHDEYATVTKVLFSGKAVFLLIFDGAKYTKETFHRQIGTILEMILEQCPSAAIALVSNKCDNGKRCYISNKENKQKVIEEVKKQIKHRGVKTGEIPYLFNEIFSISCVENSMHPILKDATSCCCGGNISKRKNKGIEKLKSCIAELYLDTTLVDGGESIIPLERQYPSMWNDFHEKLKVEELKKKSDNSTYGLEPLTVKKAEEIYMTMSFRDVNKELLDVNVNEDEHEEINWLIAKIVDINKTASQDIKLGVSNGQDNLVLTKENTENIPQTNASTPTKKITEDFNVDKEMVSTSIADISSVYQSNQETNQQQPMRETNRDPKEVPEEVKVKERCHKAIEHLQNAGKLVKLKENSRKSELSTKKQNKISDFVFPDPTLLTNSLRTVLSHDIKDTLFGNKPIWNKITPDVSPTKRRQWRKNILEKGFMSKKVMDLLFMNKEAKEPYFDQKVVENVLKELNIACQWTIEHDGSKEDGWLIPTLIDKSVTSFRNNPPKELKDTVQDFMKMEYEANISSNSSINTPMMGIGLGHRMLLNLLKKKQWSIKVIAMANQPLEERDPGVVFISSGNVSIGHEDKEKLGTFILTEEERVLPSNNEEDSDYFPHVRVLKVFIKCPEDMEWRKRVIRVINDSLNETLHLKKNSKEMEVICKKAVGQEQIIPAHYPQPYPDVCKVKSTDFLKNPTNRNCKCPDVEDSNTKSLKYSCILPISENGFDPPPPDDDAKGLGRIKTLSKSFITIVGIISSIFLIVSLATDPKVQKGNYWYSYLVLIAILYIPVIPNIAIFEEKVTTQMKIILIILHLSGPCLPVVATWLWLCRPKSKNLWNFMIKANINFGMLESSLKLIFTCYMYAYGIIPLPWNKAKCFKDSEGNTFCPPAGTVMFVVSFMTLVYTIYNSWTSFPPHDRQLEDGQTMSLLDPEIEAKWGRSNQLTWKRKIYITFVFSLLLTAFRLITIFLIMVYLSWWCYIIGLLHYLGCFGLVHYLVRDKKAEDKKAEYSLPDIFWLLFLLLPIPTPVFSKKATHTLLLLHTIITNVILLVLLFIILHQTLYQTTKLSSELLFSHDMLVISVIMSAVLMPLATYWHCWLTWAHTHRRILQKFPGEKAKPDGSVSKPDKRYHWYVLRKVLIYVSTLLILGLAAGLIIFSSHVGKRQNLLEKNLAEICQNTTVTPDVQTQVYSF